MQFTQKVRGKEYKENEGILDRKKQKQKTPTKV